MYNIIQLNGDWYFDTINECHVQKAGIASYIAFIKNNIKN